MKNPALARVFSVLLAILSLVLCISGVYGYNKAGSQRTEQIRKYDLLVSRTEEYREISEKIKNSGTYKDAEKELNSYKEEHESSAAAHKADVATYSATKGGLEMGSEALEQGEGMINMITPLAAMAVYAGTGAIDAAESVIYEKNDGSVGIDVAKLDEAGKTVEEILQKIGILQPRITEYESKSALLAQLQGEQAVLQQQLTQLQLLANEEQKAEKQEILDDNETIADKEIAESETTESETTEAEMTEAEMNSGKTTEREIEQETGDIKNSIAEETVSTVSENPETTGETTQADETLSADIKGDSEIAEISSEAVIPEEVQPIVPTQPGIPADDFPAAEYAEQEAIPGPEIPAQMPDTAVPPMEIAEIPVIPAEPAASVGKRILLCKEIAYEEEIETLTQALKEIEEKIKETVKYLEEHKEEYLELIRTVNEYMSDYNRLSAELNNLRSQLNDIAVGVTGAYAEVIHGYWEVQQKEKELEEETLPKLKETKEKLDEEYVSIVEKDTINEQLKEDETRLTSLKVLLQKNENINSAVNEGEDILSASENEIPRFEKEYKINYKNKLLVCALLFIAAFAGFLGIPSAFEKNNSRFMLIAPVVIFTVCALAADIINTRCGNGKVYAAIVAAIIGLIQLIIIVPKKKRIISE